MIRLRNGIAEDVKNNNVHNKASPLCNPIFFCIQLFIVAFFSNGKHKYLKYLDILSFFPFLFHFFMTFFKDHPIYCLFGATVGVLALKYPNCALFHEEREGVCRKSGWPIVGSLPTILSRKDAIHELFLERFTELKAKTMYKILIQNE
jgi:hypothetical protein